MVKVVVSGARSIRRRVRRRVAVRGRRRLLHAGGGAGAAGRVHRELLRGAHGQDAARRQRQVRHREEVAQLAQGTSTLSFTGGSSCPWWWTSHRGHIPRKIYSTTRRQLVRCPWATTTTSRVIVRLLLFSPSLRKKTYFSISVCLKSKRLWALRCSKRKILSVDYCFSYYFIIIYFDLDFISYKTKMSGLQRQGSPFRSLTLCVWLLREPKADSRFKNKIIFWPPNYDRRFLKTLKPTVSWNNRKSFYFSYCKRKHALMKNRGTIFYSQIRILKIFAHSIFRKSYFGRHFVFAILSAT